MDPRELANILDITEGSDGAASSVTSLDEKRKEIGDFVRRFNAFYGESGSLTFWSEFGSLYLPSFVKFLTEIPTRFDSNVDVVILDWMSMKGLQIWTSRFCRTHQEDAVKLWAVTLERISHIPHSSFHTWLETLRSFPVSYTEPLKRSYLAASIDAYQMLLLRISAASPPGFTFPPPSDATRKRLKTLAPLLQDASKEQLRYDARRADGYASSFVLIASASEGRILSAEEIMELSTGGREDPERWSVCQFSTSDAAIKGDCDESGKGDGMLMCGGCQTVRYCSRAHQKQHWKEHKPICFAPSW